MGTANSGRRLVVERLGAAVLLAAALALDIWGTWQLGQRLGANTDLFPRWYGTRVWMLEGRSVYDPAVKAGVFAAMYGRPPRRDGPASELDDFAFGFHLSTVCRTVDCALGRIAAADSDDPLAADRSSLAPSCLPAADLVPWSQLGHHGQPPYGPPAAAGGRGFPLAWE